MRLIDAELLKGNCKITGEFENNFQCVDLATLGCVIDNQPTAYDVDKVAAEMEKELKRADEEKLRCVKENPLQFDSAKGYANGIAVAIQIVKGGGVDGDA